MQVLRDFMMRFYDVTHISLLQVGYFISKMRKNVCIAEKAERGDEKDNANVIKRY